MSKKMSPVSAIFAALTLLAACSGTASVGTTTRAGACPYEIINLNTSLLPQPISYPEGFVADAYPPLAHHPAGSPAYGFEELKEPPVAHEGPITVDPQGGYVRNYALLSIQYSNPREKKIAGCGLRLRTYNGELVGPTMRVKPGQTLKFAVQNNLPGQTPPSMLDMTNLHTHGLEVSPGGSPEMMPGTIPPRPRYASDNVMINYGPGEYQDYEIKVPKDHPSGTFWYHAHSHGSTATQVSSGMAGALIVEDDKNNLNKPGSDRSILPESLQVKEKTLVFQSIFYNEDGEIANLNLSDKKHDDWPKSQRSITINGQLVPKITMRPGEVQRWRMIGATFEQLLRLRLAGHDLHEIALDGIYLPQVDAWSPSDKKPPLSLQAGYRSDVLVKASTKPGTYMMTSPPDDTNQGRLADPRARAVQNQVERVVAAVVVAGESVQNKALPTTDEMRKLAYGWTNGTEDPSLKDLWNQDPANKDPDPTKHHTQSIHFDLDSNSEDAHFSINNKAYDPINGPVRKLVLGRIDEWDLVTDNTGPSPRGPFVSPPGAHIFHIHTNPFLVVRRGPNGEDETVWKDSIVVPKGQPVTVYTQYKKFTGEFVIHCHLLDHEDNGMMQAVGVVKETR